MGSTVRTAEQSDVARFWTVNFFSQFNQMVRGIADEKLKDVGDTARLFALVSFAAADSQISVYDAKYLYNFWRPITAIQQAHLDGNPLTTADPSWTSFAATPPYPENSSGANCLTASITTVLRHFFGTDQVSFAVSSTAPNLMTNPRTYTRLSDLEKEMIEARIWQGIHFRSAELTGWKQGRRIGAWTYKNYLRPLRSHK
jgi:hypothetical protein